MNNNKQTASGGIGFCGLLTIAFIVLKLLGKISWSWLWVLSPIWIPLALAIVFLLIYLVVALLAKKSETARWHKSKGLEQDHKDIMEAN